MCNTCANCTNGSNFSLTNSNTSSCSFCGCNQRICRDGCGNIWVRQNSSRCGNGCCRCNSCGNGCCGNCSCCNNGTNVASTTNGGNDGNNYGCVTICGRIFNGATTQTASTQNGAAYSDYYYARQYGLYPYNRSSCCCGNG